MSTIEMNKTDGGALMKMARGIERAGNKIPHASFLFLYLMIIVAIASAICAALGVSVTYDVVQDGVTTPTTVSVISLLTPTGIVTYLTNMLSEYKALSILSQNIMIVMAFSVPEEAGFFSAIMRKSLLSAPKKIVVYVLCVVGVCCNICGDAGMILACSLGAIIYKALGRNPWLGAVTGYASCAAGYTANLMPASIDVNTANITQQVCDTMGIDFTVHALSNYIFMVVATFVLAAVCTFISEKFLTKMMGDRQEDPTPEELDKARLTPAEEKGLKASGIAFAVFVIVLLIGCVPKNGVLRAENGDLLPSSPLMSSVVSLIFIGFLTLGISFGIAAGTIKKSKDIPTMMAKGVSTSSSTWVVFFFVSQFLYFFNTSNLATVISVSGERLLRSLGLVGLPLMIIFIVFTSIVNVFMYSASSKYLIFAPIFVPMFNALGINPAWTMLAYRIGDSCTNSITPLNACLVACVAILNNYRDERYNKEEAGLGTIIAPTFVICCAMLVVFILQFTVFWLLGLPIGL